MHTNECSIFWICAVIHTQTLAIFFATCLHPLTDKHPEACLTNLLDCITHVTHSCAVFMILSTQLLQCILIYLKFIGIQLQQCGPLIEIGLMPSHHSHGFRVEIRRNQISISKLNGALDPFDMADFGQHDRIWDSFTAYVNHWYSGHCSNAKRHNKQI